MKFHRPSRSAIWLTIWLIIASAIIGGLVVVALWFGGLIVSMPIGDPLTGSMRGAVYEWVNAPPDTQSNVEIMQQAQFPQTREQVLSVIQQIIPSDVLKVPIEGVDITIIIKYYDDENKEITNEFTRTSDELGYFLNWWPIHDDYIIEIRIAKPGYKEYKEIKEVVTEGLDYKLLMFALLVRESN